MDAGTDRTVALISIRPEFSERILSGDKRVEFRKVCIRANVTHAVIYSTMPVARIVGFFEILDQDVAEPDALWRRYNAVAGIHRRRFKAYFADCEKGVAINIGRVFRLDRPISLSEVEDSQAPQSFKYITQSAFDAIANDGASEIVCGS